MCVVQLNPVELLAECSGGVGVDPGAGSMSPRTTSRRVVRAPAHGAVAIAVPALVRGGALVVVAELAAELVAVPTARVLVAAALEHTPVRAFIDDTAARMARSGYGWGDDAEIFDEATRVQRELVREATDPLGEHDDDDVVAALAAVAAVDRRR